MNLKQASLILLISIFLNACLQTENSSSGDGYAPVGDELFLEANAVFASKCVGCHHVFHTMNEADFIAEGDVVPGDPENSEVYYRNVGSLGPNGPKTMPSIGTISTDEVAAIYNWISALQ